MTFFSKGVKRRHQVDEDKNQDEPEAKRAHWEEKLEEENWYCSNDQFI